MKIKSLLNTPKRITLTIIIALIVLSVLGTGILFASTTVANLNSIGSTAASQIALNDAGYTENEVTRLTSHFERDDGRYVFDVGFFVGTTEYDYKIDAENGNILSRDVDGIVDTTQDIKPVTLEEAKAIAIADAGLTVDDVAITKMKEDIDDGVAVYDIEFITDTTKYDYEIEVDTGRITERSSKIRVNSGVNTGNSNTPVAQVTPTPTSTTQATQITESQATPTTSQEAAAPTISTNPSQNAEISVQTAIDVAYSDAGVQAQDVTLTESKRDYDDGRLMYDIEFYSATAKYEYEIDAYTGAVYSKDIDMRNTQIATGGNISSTDRLTVEAAQTKALEYAKLSAAANLYIESELDFEDGIWVYEFEIKQGRMEYDITINAVTGALVEYDEEYDD